MGKRDGRSVRRSGHSLLTCPALGSRRKPREAIGPYRALSRDARCFCRDDCAKRPRDQPVRVRCRAMEREDAPRPTASPPEPTDHGEAPRQATGAIVLAVEAAPFERHIFTVIARVTFVGEEADSDYHFILQERGYHMIAETPAPYFDHIATLHYRRMMARARRAARTCARASLVSPSSTSTTDKRVSPRTRSSSTRFCASAT
jgi:hypothetical protein